MQKEHFFLHDLQTTIRRVSFVFPQERSKDWKEEKSRNIFIARGGGKA
jgi:hypothetical protein